MNELSNHDHSRFLTRTNHKVGRVAFLGHAAASEDVDVDVMREAVLMQMTWPGAPTLYYGDEAGVCGFTDPDNRRTYPWGHENQDLIAYHRAVIRIHKKYPVLTHGSFRFLHGEKNCIAYGRFSKEEQIVVVFHNGDDTRPFHIPVWPRRWSRRQAFAVCSARTATAGERTTACSLWEKGELVLELGPKTGMVFLQEKKEESV